MTDTAACKKVTLTSGMAALPGIALEFCFLIFSLAEISTLIVKYYEQ